MRITGGSLSGRIVFFPLKSIRPAMDRMRESMFATLGNLDGIRFLDLFAGSGIMTLEALSRGVRTALLVERDSRKKKVILKNLRIAEESQCSLDGIRLVIMPVERFLQRRIQRYDVVFIDPPFSMRSKEKILFLADKARQPTPGGALIIHYPSVDRLPDNTENLRLYDTRNYGQSRLAFYTRDN